MAKKQTRRSVSLNKTAFEAGKLEADRRGMTFAGLVEFALGEIGVVIEPHPQQTPELAQTNAVRRAECMQRLPSRERQLLGDAFANANGFA